MSKKKGKKNIIQDFTIHDSANAMKPIKNLRKSTTDIAEPSWDEIQDDTDIIEETSTDGTKKFAYKKKKSQNREIENRPGKDYPEIVWYLISKFIMPEDVASFAGINKATYNVTKNKSFWLLIYKKHCEKHPRLPEKLRSDSFKAYGLRQTVIRALYHTYDLFVMRIEKMTSHDVPPHVLVNRKCVNVWLCKSMMYWSVYFKLRKPQVERRIGLDVLKELERIDANPEEDTQVLQVTCKKFQDVPPLMGMTLSSVSMHLTQGFRHHRLTLGFNSSPYSTKGVMPECSVVLDAVIGTIVCDWWHPIYPHSGIKIPRQEPPLLKKNFFDDC